VPPAFRKQLEPCCNLYFSATAGGVPAELRCDALHLYLMMETTHNTLSSDVYGLCGGRKNCCFGFIALGDAVSDPSVSQLMDSGDSGSAEGMDER